MKTEIFNNSKQINIPGKYKPPKEISKEKILYENICPIHHSNYIKFCTTCNKDICSQCEKDTHKEHKFINYESLIPDLKETNTLNEIIKEYNKNYNLFINIINNWKKEFDIMINEYEININAIIEYILYFNKEKINFNNIYKYRTIYSIISGGNDIKNDKILKIMKNMDKYNEKENIKNDCSCLLNNNKLKDLIESLNKDNFINKINKIIDIINLNTNKLSNKINQIVINNIFDKNDNKKYINDNNDITPGFYNQINNNSSSYKNKNTSASSLGNKNINSYDKYSSQTNHKNSGVINFDYTFCKKEYKSNNSKSINNITYNDNKNNINDLKLCVYEKKKIRQKSTDFINNIKKINISLNNNINLNENILQNSINDTKIHLFQKRNKRNDELYKDSLNVISSRTQNVLNKTFLHDYKGFDINDKDSGPELLNDTSSVVQGVKYVSHSFRNNSIDIINNKYKYFIEGRKKYLNLKSHSIDTKNINKAILTNKNHTLNNCTNLTKNNNTSSLFKLSRNINTKNKASTMVNFYKPKKNNSVENNINNNKKVLNKTFVNNTTNNSNVNNYYNKNSQIFNNKNIDNNIYVHKKYVTLDISKTLSSIDSITSSILSSNSTNKKIKGDTNNIFLNEINNNTNIYNKNMLKNKTYNRNKLKGNKLYLGLELTDTVCKIGFYQTNINNNFEFSNSNNNYISIPTIISFISNNSNKHNIKIGEDAEKYRISNASQTIFNILKLFGKNTNEIQGRKDLWPFNIYNDPKLNKPYIKIKCGNKYEKKNKFIYYNFEEILSIYLKKVFEIFFNKLKYNNLENKENYYNMNTNKYIDISIDINIGVPNYFNYLQRELLKNIISINIFQIKEINKNTNLKMKSNTFGNYNIYLNDIKIDNISNLASFSFIDKNINSNNNIQKFSKNNLILCIESGSVNISLINLSKNNNNYFIEIKSINNAEFGDEDILDNFIYDCLSDFEHKIKINCLNSPIALAKLRKLISNAKINFDKEEINQTELNINKLYGSLDIKMTLNKSNYYKSCIGSFRKIIYLLKDIILNSNIEFKDINDIILIGHITQNMKLKSMISQLFKDNNKQIYNKLINKNNDNDNDIKNYIIKGAIIQCFNNSMNIPKYKLMNITQNSFGIESINGIMDIVIEKGSNIPIKLNKYIKIKKPDKNENNIVSINIYEGDNKYVQNNKLIANNLIDIKNFKYEKKDENSIEILFQFFIDSNNNLNVYILDKNNFRRKFECFGNSEMEL